MLPPENGVVIEISTIIVRSGAKKWVCTLHTLRKKPPNIAELVAEKRWNEKSCVVWAFKIRKRTKIYSDTKLLVQGAGNL